MKYNFITIEGNIGAGKTTLASRLATDFNGKLILEAFADNPFLPEFYRNPEKNAFPLELFFLAERYQQMKTLFSERDIFSDFIVSDYLFIKSLLFATVNLTIEEEKLYKRLFTIIQPTLPQPDLILYLHLPVDKLLKNIAKRGRPYEKAITPEYLKQIQDRYINYFKSLTNQRVLIADIEGLDFEKNDKDYYQLVGILNKEHPSTLQFLNFEN